MNTTTTSNLEHIAMDGPFGLAVAIAVGVSMVALCAWALWQERGVLGPRNAILFWVLRSIALGTVIWMLLAPINVRVETSTTRQSVVVVTDISGSMLTVDTAGTSDDLRWALSTSDGARYSATRSADKAVAVIGMALKHLQLATEALKQHKPETVVVVATSAADLALQRAKQHLQIVTELPTLSDKTLSLAERLSKSLEGSEFQAFSRLSITLKKGRTPSQKGWRESLPDLEHRMTGLKRSLHELARKVSADEFEQVKNNSPALLATVQKSPRLGRVAEFVGDLHQSVLASIQETADVRMASFDQSVKWLSNSDLTQGLLGNHDAIGQDETRSYVERHPTALGTDLSSVLEQLNRDRQDQPVAAVFLIGDFAHNQKDSHPQEVAATLKDLPVYVIPIGNTQHTRDVRLQSVFAPAVAMRNDDIVIEAHMQAYDCEGEVCIVQLIQDGEVLDFREVVLDSGFASRTIRFEQHMPSIGNQQFEVAITALDDELTEENNYGNFEVNVTRSDIKVLLADEMPRWEYRYLAQLFRRDPKVDCDELLYQPRMIATGRRTATKTFPVTVDDWDQYDVVMLGDLPTEHLPIVAQESLIEYLQQRGGTLVLIAGQESMPHAYVDHPLEEILPVRPVDTDQFPNELYEFRVTEEGRNEQALMIAESEEATQVAWDFVNRISPPTALSKWRQPGPLAHTLISAIPRRSLDEAADTKNNAFLCWQPVGRGRIVYLSGPEIYRLRALRGDRLHYRFWGQLLRWAIATDLSAGTKFVRIRTDKSRYASQEKIHTTVKLTDSEGNPVVANDLEVHLTSGKKERSVPLIPNPEIPGQYHADVRSLDPGIYHIAPTGTAIDSLQKDDQEPASASFTIQADVPLEMVDTRSDRALAQQIADITGGQVLPPTAVEEMLELMNLEPIISERIETRPLWLEWKFLWIVFGCLQLEWAIRKWKGLS